MSTVSAVDSTMLGRLFGSAPLAETFGDRARLQSMLDFEAALAAAEARLGLIPATAATAIAEACRADRYDLDALGGAAARAGNPAIPLVKALTAEVGGDAARFVHWGGTSQDVIDTALALQMRAGLAILQERVAALGDALAAITETHRRTPAIARTVMQHAAPIPFGLRTAGWLGAVARSAGRLARLQRDCVLLHFFGAFGSLAALGRDGPAVATELAGILGLPLPAISLHSHRDHMADMAAGLAIVCGAAAKIANDIQLMMQTEIAETFEPSAPGKGGSSTMPHKRNPVATTVVLANYRTVGALAQVMTANMDHAYERDAGNWHAEWGTIAEMFVLTGGALDHLLDTVAALEIAPERLRGNIELTAGLVFAEAAMMVLAPTLGRLEAHHLVERACRRALAEQSHLRDVLLAMPEVTAHVGEAALLDAFEPARGFGASDHFIDRALAAWRSRPET